jgi:hypothetical protein
MKSQLGVLVSIGITFSIFDVSVMVRLE